MTQILDLRRVATITRKECLDHLTDRTFLLILAIFLVLAVLSLRQGLIAYDDALKLYEHSVAYADPTFSSPLTASHPPSVMVVFSVLGESLAQWGPLLAIAVGFDLIAGERSSRSLKTLLVRPVFRDEIITGKAVGGGIVLAIASVVAVVLALGMIAASGITVQPDDVEIAALFCAVTVLYLLAYFAVALAFSSLVDDGGKALAWTMAAFILFSILVPAAATYTGQAVAGDLPTYPSYDAPAEEIQHYLDAARTRYQTLNSVENLVLVLSPDGNYQAITKELLTDRSDPVSGWGVSSPADLLGRVWQNIVVIAVFPLVFLALAYARFIRIDLR
ncbi:ABC transporter permease [uncultured Methanofollis sp.]|uniref:ABC transporter permease n=1 Tax=uncultured Methanofollis sp. TaxID=262500 RepID=UPI00261CCE22|nr:ABC transporter permease [uncultured Methanofollis sp.]